MTRVHPIRCRCGQLQGEIRHPQRAVHAVCYCRDCQAFAHFLGDPQHILDSLGGTEAIAIPPRWVSFTGGLETLVCMSLTEHGTLRWYADCCRTPIGNTPRDVKFSHLSLFPACLGSTSTLDEVFGPIRMRVNRQSAKGRAPAAPVPTFVMALVGYGALLTWSRISGKYRQNPFFDATTGLPLVPPRVLSKAEHEKLMNAI